MAKPPPPLSATTLLLFLGTVLLLCSSESARGPGTGVDHDCTESGECASAEEVVRARQDAEAGTVQHDELRRLHQHQDLELKCDEAIGASSRSTTHKLELWTRSFYQGSHQGQHVWKYKLVFHNQSPHVYQMLTRHWVFADAKGRIHEAKGPGARGATPIMPPGAKWTYESGSRLGTKWGSMRGTFQIEMLQRGFPDDGAPEHFNAIVGRLALLSPDQVDVMTPCGQAANFSRLPVTSVQATRRVIVGAIISFEKVNEENGMYVFEYDVQINNARSSAVQIESHEWRVIDANLDGFTMAGPGLGGFARGTRAVIAAGKATRYKGLLELPTSSGVATGFFTVLVEDEDGAATTLDAAIGRVALSQDDEPINAAMFELRDEEEARMQSRPDPASPSSFSGGGAASGPVFAGRRSRDPGVKNTEYLLHPGVGARNR